VTGTITSTSSYGGAIRPDNGEPIIRFDWADCDDIGPKDVGHSTPVNYYV
jgi:hypothetical protein